MPEPLPIPRAPEDYRRVAAWLAPAFAGRPFAFTLARDGSPRLHVRPGPPPLGRASVAFLLAATAATCWGVAQRGGGFSAGGATGGLAGLLLAGLVIALYWRDRRWTLGPDACRIPHAARCARTLWREDMLACRLPAAAWGAGRRGGADGWPAEGALFLRRHASADGARDGGAYADTYLYIAGADDRIPRAAALALLFSYWYGLPVLGPPEARRRLEELAAGLGPPPVPPDADARFRPDAD